MSKKSKERAIRKAEKTKNYQLPEKFQNIGMTKFQIKKFIGVGMPIILLILIVLVSIMQVDAIERFYISTIAVVSLCAMIIIGLTIYKIIVDEKAMNREYKVFREKITAKKGKCVTFTNDYSKTRTVRSSEFETAKVGDEYFVVYWKNKKYRFPEEQIWSFVKHKRLFIALGQIIEGLNWFFMTLVLLFVISGQYAGMTIAFYVSFVVVQIVKVAGVIQENVSEKCDQLSNGEYLVIHEKIVKKSFTKVFLENDVGDIRVVRKLNLKNLKFTTGCVGDEFYTAYIGEFEEKDDLRSSWKTITKKQFETNI